MKKLLFSFFILAGLGVTTLPAETQVKLPDPPKCYYCPPIAAGGCSAYCCYYVTCPKGGGN